MSDIISLIENVAKTKSDLASASIRMPKELYSFIEGLADHLDMSRQETMLKLLEKGVELAKVALKLDDEVEAAAEIESLPVSRFHILNTNKRHSVEDHDRMLSEGCAAAFYAPWKLNIDRINQGDVVFLYENGKGIVAYGKGTGVTKKRMHDGLIDECHYQELEEFERLEKPISAAEIKKTVQKNVVLLRTMSPMPEGQLLLDLIKKRG
ncbi:hypothetical protein [Pseudomonas asiatica]|uniref:hypothetical protein n=1 Tax=Pseudomonas asiatica TaxID=2219225 RepID=UPI0018A9D7F5|nr:hypothetical protein [Pseudomonas asiatica]MBF8802161.1 hypothetical protein [Pseudomonas asiatica]